MENKRKKRKKMEKKHVQTRINEKLTKEVRDLKSRHMENKKG